MITCPFLFKRAKQGEIIKETLKSPCYFVIQVWPIVLQPLTLGQVTLYFLKEDLTVHHFLKQGKRHQNRTFSWKDHLVFFECCVYPFLLKTGNPFVFSWMNDEPWLEAMEKIHEGRGPGRPFISYRGKRFGVSWWRCGVFPVNQSYGVFTISSWKGTSQKTNKANPRNCCFFFPWPNFQVPCSFSGVFHLVLVDLWFPGETPEDDFAPRQTGIFRGADRNEVWAPGRGERWWYDWWQPEIRVTNWGW